MYKFDLIIIKKYISHDWFCHLLTFLGVFFRLLFYFICCCLLHKFRFFRFDFILISAYFICLIPSFFFFFFFTLDFKYIDLSLLIQFCFFVWLYVGLHHCLPLVKYDWLSSNLRFEKRIFSEFGILHKSWILSLLWTFQLLKCDLSAILTFSEVLSFF